jgi:hypothetical protein
LVIRAVFPQHNVEVDLYFSSWLDAQNNFSQAQDTYETARHDYFSSLFQRYAEFGRATYGSEELAFLDAISEIRRQTAYFRDQMGRVDAPPECQTDHNRYMALLDLMLIYPDAEARLVEDVNEFGSPRETTMGDVDSLQSQIDHMRAKLLDTGAICVSD